MTDRLKPCPFCGSDATDLISEAYCSNPECQISGQGFYKTAWNHRPAEDKLKKAIDILLGAIIFSRDKNLARHIITSRLKEACEDVRKLLGIAKEKK